ncbi:DUF3784 domain-containing protein [Aequorivita ciconiae]|nr:DUF3784 domain-containing protein [Aequorivita sp. H23M31]
MYFLIAGYNTMPKEKKAEYDIKRIASVMANIFFAMALVIISGVVINLWIDNIYVEITALFIAVFIGVPLLLILANSDKYKIDSGKKD